MMLCGFLVLIVVFGTIFELQAQTENLGRKAISIEGAGTTNPRPLNPPVYPKRRRTRPPSTKIEFPTSATSQEDRGVNQEAEVDDSEGVVEEALALGNSARDASPPRYQDAETAYNLAAKLGPKDPRPQIGLGNILYDQGKFSEAAKAYRTALTLASRINSLKVLFARSKPVIDRGRKTDLEGYQAFVNDNQQGQFHAFLGIALLQAGDSLSAESEFSEAIKQDDFRAQFNKRINLSYMRNAAWYALLGQSQVSLKKYKDALNSVRKALEIDPNNANYLRLLKEIETNFKD